ncbi:MAG: prolipoprotein diacylglyceryl transferase [Clostridiales bacterium]|nr:prolipoprotein diacylglyceryl transferase [Clostridiales bacterium]
MGNVISFPGLGIGEFTVNSVAFSIFGYDIMWYGIIITLAMVVGFFVALRNAKIENIKTDDVLDLAIFLIVFSMVGARLYYVLMKLEDYKSFFDVINVRKGGLAIYGGVIAGAATVFVVAKVKKLSAAKMYDMVAPGLIIGQVIGRWGNFMNAEAHGVETKLPWRMGIMYAGSTVTKYYHPTFLYESLWNLIGFAILMIMYKKKKFNGQVALSYLIWYGFGRFFIEGLRTDSLYFMKSVFGETIRVSQVVGALCFIFGIVFMIVCSRIAHDRALEHEAYDRVYSAGHDSLISRDEVSVASASSNNDGENYSVKTTAADTSETADKNERSTGENNNGKDN